MMESPGEKKLGLRNSVVMSLSFMAPALSLLATFSLVMVAGYSWAGVPLAYLVAGLMIIVTAVSFANLSKRHIRGGGVWDYAKNVLGNRLGQIPVWIYLLELLVVPAAALIPVGFFAKDWLGIPPWLTVLVAFAVVVLLANAGVKLSFRTMAILFGIQVVILLAFAVSAIVWAGNEGTFSSMAVTALSPKGSLMGWAGIIVGAAAAVFSFLGFESSSAMAAETEKPEKVIPKSVLLTAIIGTIMNTFLAWAFVLAIPTKGLFSLLYHMNPVPAMASVIWQTVPPFYQGWGNILNFAGIVAGVTGALASVTATSRILEQMGTDQVIPAAVSRLSRKRSTPALAIGIVGAVGLLVAEFLPWESVAYLIATGAIPTFLIVNFLSFWQCRGEKLDFRQSLRQRVLPLLGMILSAWIIIAGIPARMKIVLLLWIVAGFVIVSLKEALKRREGPGIPKQRSYLVISLVALAISIIVSVIWYRYHGGDLVWWHILEPYAAGSAPAIVLTLALALCFVGLPAGRLIEKKKEGVTNEQI